MTAPKSLLRTQARRLAAAALVLGTYGLARPVDVAPAERAQAAARFRFERLRLPHHGGAHRAVRAVHPDMAHYAGWISAVGAGLAYADLDGDGLPNDFCHVDPRTDTVLVAPVPGTPARYAPRVLDPAPLRRDATVAPMGCVPGDFNEDGRADVLVYYWGRTPVAFLRRGDGYVPQEVVAGDARWFTNALTTADLDGDGHADLVVGNYFPDGARILDPNATEPASMHTSMSRAYNGGVAHVLRWVGAASGDAPAVRYEEVRGVFAREVERGWTLALGAQDLDGDLLPELYLAHDFGPDRLLHNRSTPGHIRFGLVEGRRTLTSPPSTVLGRDSFKGMGVDFGDLNGDAVPDVYVSNITTDYGLHEEQLVFVSAGDPASLRRGVSPYVERGAALGLSRSGWAWDARLTDYDNDGVLEAQQATGFVRGTTNRWPELQELATGNDLLLPTCSVWLRLGPGDDVAGHQPNPFFVRVGERYTDLSNALGIDQPQVSRGIASADVDGDGDVDFGVANQWEDSYHHRNDCLRCGAFLGLHLRLPLRAGAPTLARLGHPPPDASRPAVGAAATVYLPDGRRLVAQVDGGNGHSGRRSPDLHFGLGAHPADTPVRVELRWRDPAGRPHHETLQLPPGWHTVALAWPVTP